MTVEHATLTGSQLHEPKGVAGASVGTLPFVSSSATSYTTLIGQASATASSSSDRTFTGLGDYLLIRLTLLNLRRSTTSTLRMQLSSNNGSSYVSSTIYDSRWMDNAADDAEEGATSFNLTGDEDTTYVYSNGVILLYNFNSAVETHFDSWLMKSTSSSGGGSAAGTLVQGGTEDTTTAWNALRIFPSSGTLTSGTIYLEGFKGT